MKRLTLIALIALVAFLGLWAWCHFGHSHPASSGMSRMSVDSASAGVDVTQLTAIIGSILSAIVALITGFKDLVAMFRKKSSPDEAPKPSA